MHKPMKQNDKFQFQLYVKRIVEDLTGIVVNEKTIASEMKTTFTTLWNQ